MIKRSSTINLHLWAEDKIYSPSVRFLFHGKDMISLAKITGYCEDVVTDTFAFGQGKFHLKWKYRDDGIILSLGDNVQQCPVSM